MKPIYKPRGAAREYGELALNIYTGCPHRCFYCFAPQVLHREREAFHTNVQPRDGIIEATRRQLEKEYLVGKLIHLCFTCDPYPTDYDTRPTREIIKLLKAYGNHVQILTKGDGRRDFDLLGGDDWYGVTLDGKDGTNVLHRYLGLRMAHDMGILRAGAGRGYRIDCHRGRRPIRGQGEDRQAELSPVGHQLENIWP